jgi:hypothetical protein
MDNLNEGAATSAPENKPAPAPTDPIGFIQQLSPTGRKAWLGGLLEACSEEEIVDGILLHKLTPEQHKLSRLLNQALR